VIKNAYEAHAVSAEIFGAGDIWIEAHPHPTDAERIELVIRDNGMGLSPDELDEVRRFIPGNTSKKRYGTGFGLPTAKRKIDDHGGSLAGSIHGPSAASPYRTPSSALGLLAGFAVS